jgi:hypothetical protein
MKSENPADWRLNDEDVAEAQAIDQDFLDVIARAEDLTDCLADSGPAERAAIVDIRSYLCLIERTTDVPEKELKDLFGCRRDLKELPRCDIEDLKTSRRFLSFVAQVVLLAEDSQAAEREQLTFAVQGFRRLRKECPQLADSDPALILSRAKDNLARGELREAWEYLSEDLADVVAAGPRRTGSGKLVFLGRAATVRLADAVANSPLGYELSLNHEHEDDLELA